MNYLSHPQCTFCAAMIRNANLDQSNRQFYQVKSFSNYVERPPLLYCYDMTKKPIQDNYITYCNIIDGFPTANESQYVQVIDSGVSNARVQVGVCFNKVHLEPSNKRFATNKQNENNCEAIICTCNDFISYTNQNSEIYDTGRDVGQQYDNTIPSRDSIDSRHRSIADQPDTSIYSNGSLFSDPMCRFCHLTKNTQLDQLISPCYCCGTLKYVHQICLKTWLEVSKSQRENSGNKPPHCELCNFQYVRKRKFQFGQIRQPKLSPNDCALHLIFLCSLLVMVTSASVTILCFTMEKSTSIGNSGQLHDKSSANGVKYTDLSKSNDRLCEYLSKLNLKGRTNSPRPSAPKSSVLCDLILNKDQKLQKISDRDHISSDPTMLPLSKIAATNNWPKETHQRMFNKNNNNNNSRNRLWILTPEEAVTLASGVIFFVAFFIAMMVQVKSSYTCYQLVREWMGLNYKLEVQSLELEQQREKMRKKYGEDLDLKNGDGRGDKTITKNAVTREYIERCVTEI